MALAPGLAAAQRQDAPPLSSPPFPGPPQYLPLNPHVASRSALGTEPLRPPGRPGWRWEIAADYGSAVERDAFPTAFYLLDAEIMRASVVAAHDLGAASFVELRGGVGGAYAGFADAFFDRYHALIRYNQKARTARPRNRFAYLLDVEGSPVVERRPVALALDDARLTLGWRLGAAAQAVVVATLPTSTAPAGYSRGTPAAGAAVTARLAEGSRAVIDAGAAVGATPRRGPSPELQRERFYAASWGMRLRLWGANAAYGTLFYHSPTHRGTGLPEFDGRELTADFGWLLARGGGRRVWRVGLTEDFGPRDGAIDLALRVGTSW